MLGGFGLASHDGCSGHVGKTDPPVKYDGGPVCRMPGQSCTINADCCSGYVCITPTGSTVGTCGMPPPPSYDGGSGCSFYGQACSASTPCCNNVTCLAMNGAPCTGTNCWCYTIVN